MDDKPARIALCVMSGTADKAWPYPPGMKGQDGADEITKLATEEGLVPALLLGEALIPAMAAKAMNSSMRHLKSFISVIIN